MPEQDLGERVAALTARTETERQNQLLDDAQLRARLDGHGGQLDALSERVAGVEGKLDTLADMTRQILTRPRNGRGNGRSGGLNGLKRDGLVAGGGVALFELLHRVIAAVTTGGGAP